MIRIHTYNKKEEDKSNRNVLDIESVFVADPNHFYTLEHRTNISYDDNVKVTIDKEGFLNQINVTTTSRVPAILLEMMEIAKAALQIATPFAAIPYLDVLVDPANPDDLPEYVEGIELKIKELTDVQNSIEGIQKQIETDKEKLEKDLPQEQRDEIIEKIKNDKRKVDKLTENLQKIKDWFKKEGIQFEKYKKYEKYGIDFIAVAWQKNVSMQLPLHAVTGAGKAAFQGIFYRPVIPCKVIIKVALDPSNPSNISRYERMFYFPNKSPVIAFDIKRPAFTTTIKNLTFTQGVLTTIELNKPSGLLEALKIPSAILKSVAGLPLELLKFRVERGTEYEKLLQTQINQISLERKLLDLQMQQMQGK